MTTINKRFSISRHCIGVICTLLLFANCSLFLPNASYTIYRQNPEFEYLYTVATTIPDTDRIQISKTFITTGSYTDTSSGIPVVRVVPGAYLIFQQEKTNEALIYKVLPENLLELQYPGGLDTGSIFQDDQPGLLALWRDTVTDIEGLYRLFTGPGDPPLLEADRLEIESNRDLAGIISSSSAVGMIWHPPTQGGSAGYRILWASGFDLAIQRSENINMSGSDAVFFDEASASETINDSFELLNSSLWETTAFWNQASTRLHNYGFAASGNFNWFTASRFSGRGESEEILFSLNEDTGQILKIQPVTAVDGAAGPYVLLRNTRNQTIKTTDTFNFNAYNAQGTRTGSGRVFGHQVVYLGEFPGEAGLELIFASVTYYSKPALFDAAQPNLYISLFALPMSSLEAGR